MAGANGGAHGPHGTRRTHGRRSRGAVARAEGKRERELINAWRSHLYATGVAYKFKVLHKSPFFPAAALDMDGASGEDFSCVLANSLCWGSGRFPNCVQRASACVSSFKRT